jgi:hypothetical protein
MKKTILILLVLSLLITACSNGIEINEVGSEAPIIPSSLELSVAPDTAFNVQLEVPPSYQSIQSGDELWAVTKILNLEKTQRMDIVLTYDILNMNGEKMYTTAETVAIETQASFVGKLKTPSNLAAGAYIVRLTVTAPGDRKASAQTSFGVTKGESDQQVVIKFSLFDIETTIPSQYKKVLPGAEILGTIKLLNVGSAGRIDVFLKHWITGPAGQIISESRETVAVETQNYFVRAFDLPDNSPQGSYRLHTQLSYPGLKTEPISSAVFIVESRAKNYGWGALAFLGVVGLLFSLNVHTRVRRYQERRTLRKEIKHIVNERVKR